MQCSSCGAVFHEVDALGGSCPVCGAALVLADDDVEMDDAGALDDGAAPMEDERPYEQEPGEALEEDELGLISGPDPREQLTLTDILGELARASRQQIPGPTPMEESYTLDVTAPARTDQIAPLLDEGATFADATPKRQALRLRVMLWNIANLGGAFAHKAVRPVEMMEAIARIIREIDPDVIAILEVLARTGRPAPPKMPQRRRAPRERRDSKKKMPGPLTRALSAKIPKEALNVATEKKLAPSERTLREVAFEPLVNVLGMFFDTRAQTAHWPEEGAAPRPFAWGDFAALAEQAENAWRDISEPVFARTFANGGVEHDAEGEDESEDEDGSEGDDVDPRMLRVRVDKIEGKEKLEDILKEVRWPDMRGFLEAHGYAHWIDGDDAKTKDKAKTKDRAKTKDKAKTKEEAETRGRKRRASSIDDEKSDEEGEDDGGVAADRRADAANRAIWCLRRFMVTQFAAFLEQFASAAPDTLEREGLDQWLASAVFPRRMEAYNKRLAEFEKANAELEAAGKNNPGVREVRRILDELNELPGDKYDGWPPPVVDDQELQIAYTQGETYGVFWKPSRVAVQAAPTYVNEHWKDRLFIKRQPIRTVFTFNGVSGGPSLAVHAWHPPAPSRGHRRHRGQDFRTFVHYCQAERAAEEAPLSVLLSDLNIDTVKQRKKKDTLQKATIEECVPPLTWQEFFQGVCGPRVYGDVMVPQAETHSTLVNSKFTPDTVIAELHAALDGIPDEQWKGRLSRDELVRKIEALKPPQQNVRFGCSAYDKILPMRSNAGAWRLVQWHTAVVPFPAALAREEELGLFQFPAWMPDRCRKMLGLLGRDAPGLLPVLRASPPPGPRRGKKDPLLPLVANAKLLSDHLPMYAELVLINDGAPVEIVKEEVRIDDVPDAASDVEMAVEMGDEIDAEIERLCTTLELAGADLDREEASRRLMSAWDDGAGRWNTATISRIVGAFQHDEVISGLYEPQMSTADWLAKSAETGGLKPAKVASALPAELRARGLVPKPNRGGGDCLFRALAQLLLGDEEEHADLRRAVVHHLDDLLSADALPDVVTVGQVSRRELRIRVGHLLDWHRLQWPNAAAYRRTRGSDPLRQYLLAMRAPGCWGDLIAIAAASHLFGVRFRLYVGLEDGFWTDEIDLATADEMRAPELALLNTRNTHFEALAATPETVGTPERPARWEELLLPRPALRTTRVRDEASDDQDRAMDTTGEEPKAVAITGALPAPSGAVFHWPGEVHWTLAHVQKHPRALFLFGENGTAWHTKKKQDDTQAVIRPAHNALGIRTCWEFGGVAGSLPGGMIDAELSTRNAPTIDADCAEALQRLRDEDFDTLVVPRLANGKLTLGLGTAKLDRNAPDTYNHLCDAVANLEAAALVELGGVKVRRRATGVAPPVARQDPRTLFVEEASMAMHATRPGGDNVVRIRTSVFPAAAGDGAFFSDAVPAHRAAIDEDFDFALARVREGAFDRVELPADSEGQPTLGEKGQLDVHAPGLYQHMQERVEHLEETGADVRTSLAPPLKRLKTSHATPPEPDLDGHEH